MLVLAAVSAPAVVAQSGAIPGRDLLAYPVGLVAEPAALPGMLGLGLYNPAAPFLPDSTRLRLAAGAMNTPADIGATAQVFGASTAWRRSTVTVSLIRAAVGGLVRTDSDPLTIGNDVAYSTMVGSVGMSTRVRENVVVGMALRARTGRLDFDRHAGVSIDAGFVADHLTRLDARVGMASYLASPWRGGDDPPTWLASGDLRVAGQDSVKTIRVGVSVSSTAEG